MAHSDKKSGFFSRNIRFFVLILVYVTLFLVVSTIMLVTLTQPAGQVRVPDLTGKKYLQVHNVLLQKDLRPVLSFREAADIDSGLVLRQHPEAGSIISRESRVKLVVSRDIRKVSVPSLIGDELVIARNKLRTLNLGERKISLGTGVVSYIPSEEHAENIVIEQSPKPGERLAPDSKVNLLVSMGSLKPEMKMPAVTSQHIDLVFDMLLSYGVNIEETITPVESVEESGVILAQTPEAGAGLQSGKTVTLTIGYFERDMNYYRSYEKVSLIVPGGKDDSAAPYEAWVEDDGKRRVRFSRECEPGERISFMFYRQGNARIEILRNKEKEKVLRIDTSHH